MSVLDEVINSASLTMMLEYYGIEKQKTGQYLCPFHNDTHASLSVTPDDKHWQCFTCGEKGNIDNLVEKMEMKRGNNMDYRHRMDFIIKLQNLNVEFSLESDKAKKLTPQEQQRKHYIEIMKDAWRIAINGLKDDTNHHGIASRYLASRGISAKTIEAFGIGYNMNSMLEDNLVPKYTKEELYKTGILGKSTTKGLYYDFQYDRVLIPIMDEKGAVVAFGGRSLDKNPDFKYKNTKTTDIFKKSKILFNLNNAKFSALQQKEIIIVEGYFDVISAYEMGIKNSVALMGVELTDEHRELLSKFGSNHNDFTITLCLDNDEAGRKSMCKIIPLLVADGYDVNVIDTSKLNKGKDMNDLLISGIEISDLDKVKIPAVDFLFSYSFDFYKNKFGKINIDTVHKVYDAVFKNEQFNNSFNEAKFKEYVVNEFGYSANDVESACHPTSNSTLLATAMQNVFCFTIKKKLKDYAVKTDNRILQQFLAQNRLTINLITEGMNSSEIIQNNGTKIDVPKYCNEVLLNTDVYREFEANYDKNFDRLLDNVYGLDKSGEMVKVFLNAKQKDIISRQYKSSFDNDVIEFFNLHNDRFVKLFIADNEDELKRMYGDDYDLRQKTLEKYNNGEMTFINYGGKFSILEIERLAESEPLKYTNAAGDDFQIVLVVNNSKNILSLQPENYINKNISKIESVDVLIEGNTNNVENIRREKRNTPSTRQRVAELNETTKLHNRFQTKTNE